jgi:hypothetical protein
MRSVWRGIVRTIFWSYDRGSWPYDLMVIAIVIFVLASPRSWFHDQPKLGVAASSNVVLISEDTAGQTHTYRLAATALSPEKRTTKPTPELERETHNILDRTVDDLNDHTFQVLRISPGLAADGSVLYYDVTVSP